MHPTNLMNLKQNSPHLQPTTIMSLARGASLDTSAASSSNIRPTDSLPLDTDTDNRPVLVLDLDETLVHHPKIDPSGKHCTGNRFIVPTTTNGDLLVFERPWAREFVTSVARGYRVVVFTAGSDQYALGIVKFLDPDGVNICAHLSFEACTQVSWFGRPAGPSQTKDLTKVVTNLRRVLLVDNTAECLEMQPDNGMLIRGWSGEAGDDELFRLEHFLCHYAGAKDMRRVAERWKTAVIA